MKLASLLTILVVLVVTSCTTTSRVTNFGQISDLKLAPLATEQYSILKDVEGSATASNVLIFGLGYMQKAKNGAMYEAIGKIPGADMLIAPRFEVDKFSVPFFYNRVTVKVKAKAVQLKTN